MGLICLLRGYQPDVSSFTEALSDDWLNAIDNQQGHAAHGWATG